MAKFQTRARTVDMLGRQQIAGIPTAISELYKNAYDAYANQAVVNFLLQDHLFILRDDGMGMTPSEFMKGWLTVGTESKLEQRANAPKDQTQAPRAIMGEKGIGRLAISVIGPQVLVLTRSRDSTAPLVASLIHWGLFEIPGVNLDEIDIPLIELARNTVPSTAEVDLLRESLTKTITNLSAASTADHIARMRGDVEGFTVNPAELEVRLPPPHLSSGDSGTHFYITPTDESLEALLQPAGGEVSRLQRMLIGFANTMTPVHTPPAMRTYFFFHRSVDDVQDIIEEKEFFTPADFQMVDHTMNGTFDEYGQYQGHISIYGLNPEPHNVVWKKARGNPTLCGPFKISVAYVQGAQRQSRLDPDDFVRITRKLDRAAGLYVYRDGIRILPYGDNRYDFLDIELRRTKSAGYYFWSYRRMFGAIELTSTANSELQEKAGREGFRENTAYRQFREMLENFFLQTAAEFFREGSESDSFAGVKAELDAREKAKQRRERSVTVRRNKFRAQLEDVLQKISNGAVVQEAEAATSEFLSHFELARSARDPAQQANLLVEAEVRARAKLQEVKDAYRIARPRGIGLGKALTREWDAYVSESAELQQQVFPALERDLDKLITEKSMEVGVSVDFQRRLERVIADSGNHAHSEIARGLRSVKASLDAANTRIDQLLKESRLKVEAVINQTNQTMASKNITEASGDEVMNFRLDAEQQLDIILSETLTFFSALEDRLNRLVPESSSEISEDMEAVMDEELLELRERSENDLELAALGMAVEVINHEFDSSLRAIRNNLRRLKSWSDANERLQRVYDSLSGSFDHLDAYLTLFTPLQRRLYRREIQMNGSDIHLFLRELFRQRIQQDEVSLDATEAFRKHEITGFPSTFYPVFVNLIDNALFWLADSVPQRRILLDVDGQDLIVRDNGPGVLERDQEAIFELGFTKKPAGRGLGLHLSRELLDKADWDLSVDPPPPDGGAAFRMHPRLPAGSKDE